MTVRTGILGALESRRLSKALRRIQEREEMEKKNIRVVAAVIREDGRVFATQRGYGNYKDWWEFPGGKIEPGETPEAAVVREIQEEFHLSMDCFFCHIEEGELTLLEHEAAKWLPLGNLRQVNWLPADILVIEAIEQTAL